MVSVLVLQGLGATSILLGTWRAGHTSEVQHYNYGRLMYLTIRKMPGGGASFQFNGALFFILLAIINWLTRSCRKGMADEKIFRAAVPPACVLSGRHLHFYIFYSSHYCVLYWLFLSDIDIILADLCIVSHIITM